MATIDLGKIKFNWRNEYDGSTAYVPDDCVYYADGLLRPVIFVKLPQLVMLLPLEVLFMPLGIILHKDESLCQLQHKVI